MIKVLKAIVLSGILFVSFQEVFGVDELYLTGNIKSYDKERGIVWVQVNSEGCKGLREFKVPESVRSDLEHSLIGQRIEFYINSSRCEKDKVYEMILGRKR